MGLGFALCLAGLVVAQQVSSHSFLYGLVVSGGGIGTFLAALAAQLLGSRLWRPGVAGGVAVALAAAAALGRVGLALSRPDPSAAPPRIVMWREIALGVPIALALAALVLGAHVAQRTIALPPGGLAPRARKLDLAGAVLALAGALYTLGPLFQSLGLPLNHWTFLGLVLLAAIAFLLVSTFEWLFGAHR